jgi:hypothetical protein
MWQNYSILENSRKLNFVTEKGGADSTLLMCIVIHFKNFIYLLPLQKSRYEATVHVDQIKALHLV